MNDGIWCELQAEKKKVDYYKYKSQQLREENNKLRECVEFLSNYENYKMMDSWAAYNKAIDIAKKCLAELDKGKEWK